MAKTKITKKSSASKQIREEQIEEKIRKKQSKQVQEKKKQAKHIDDSSEIRPFVFDSEEAVEAQENDSDTAEYYWQDPSNRKALEVLSEFTNLKAKETKQTKSRVAKSGVLIQSLQSSQLPPPSKDLASGFLSASLSHQNSRKSALLVNRQRKGGF